MSLHLPAAEPSTGTTIGPYEVIGALGRGGMATVLEVRDTRDDGVRALKLLLPDAMSDEVRSRFHAEFRTLEALDHQNIVRVFEAGELDGRPYIVMERLQGQDLRGVVEDWRDLPPTQRFSEAEQILVQVARALAFIHDRGLVHRDVTPGNIFVSPDGAVKIMDFGVVKEPGVDRTRVGEMVGTIAYVSPEQIRGEPVDARADLYSLGTVLYLMLTGRRPFNASTLSSYLNKHQNLRPRAPREVMPTVPHHLDQICLRLLEKDAGDRFGSAHHLLSVLGAHTRSTEGFDGKRWPPRLVGRTAEQTRLREALANLAAGHGELVLLEGASGFGKSRLIKELEAQALEIGMPVFRGSCVGRRPYGPFRQMLPELLGDDELPVPLRTGLHSPEAPVERFAVHGAFRDLVRARLPAMVLIDDMEFADSGTYELLEFLVRDLLADRPVPVLFLLARQPPMGEDIVPRRLDALRDAGGIAQHIRLVPVSVTAVEELLLQLVPDARETRVLARRLHREGEGNPHFIGEMVRGLVEEGVIRASDDGYVLDLADVSRVRLPIPTSIRDALRERLAGLSDAARRAAQLVAICDQEVTLDVLLEALRLPEDELLDDLEELLEAGVVRQREVGTEELYVLAHHRMGDVLTEDLDGVTRTRLHAAAGAAMERLYRHRLASVVESVAHHFEHGDRPAKAYDYLVRAGNRLMARSFMVEAVDYFERALRVEPEAREYLPLDVADRRLASLRVSRGRAFEHMGSWSKAFDDYKAAEDLARLVEERALRCKALASMGSLALRHAHFDEAEVHLTEALALADELGDTELRLSPLFALGSTRWVQGDLDGARRYWLETLAVAGTVKNDRALGEGYRGLGIVAMCRGNAAEARKYLEQSCQKFDQLGLHSALAISRVNLVELAHCTGNLRKGLQTAEKTIAQAREVQHRQGIALGLMYRTLVLVDLGRLQEAEDNATEALEILRDLEAHDDELGCYVHLMRIAMARQDFAAAERLLDDLQPLLVHDSEGFTPLIAGWTARLHAEAGRHEQVAEALARATEGEEKTWPYQRVRLALIASRAHYAAGDRERATAHARKAQEIADQCGFRFYSLKAHALLARLVDDEQEQLKHKRVTRNLSRSLAANLGREDAETFLAPFQL